MIEDTPGYREMMRMTHDDFLEMLRFIEPDITPRQVIGGHKVISAAERLTLAIRFLATGATLRSLSFQFQISKLVSRYPFNAQKMGQHCMSVSGTMELSQLYWGHQW